MDKELMVKIFAQYIYKKPPENNEEKDRREKENLDVTNYLAKQLVPIIKSLKILCLDRASLVQKLASFIGATSYLEIGINGGYVWDKIDLPVKVSVDINPEYNAMFTMSSDKFFRQNNQRFDIIFIDGWHKKTQVLRDLEHSIRVLNPGGIIIMHDTLPMNAMWAEEKHCWNAWEAFAYLRQHRSNLFMASVVTGEPPTGCGIVMHGTQELYRANGKVDLQYYLQNANSLMNIMDIDELLNKIEGMK